MNHLLANNIEWDQHYTEVKETCKCALCLEEIEEGNICEWCADLNNHLAQMELNK